MASLKDSMAELMQIDGALGTCVVDWTSGMLLGKQGGGVDLDLAAAGNTQVVKAKMKTMKDLGIVGDIEDILITLQDQLHIIRISETQKGLFIYLVLDKEKSNLALARHKVRNVDSSLTI